MSIKTRRLCPPKEQLYRIFKNVAPPHFAVLVLTILILISPVARAIGPDAFLILTYLLLFFYPHGPIGEHVEKVAIHLSICALGLSISFLTVCGTIWLDNRSNKGQAEYTTTSSKVLGACMLIFLCFLGGLCQSLYPRIKMAVRILLFSSTWTITTGATSIHSRIFTNQFYPAALAAGVSLLAILTIFPRSAQDDFALDLVKVFSVKRALLEQSVVDFFGADQQKGFVGSRKPSHRLTELRKDASDVATSLKMRFDSARVELNYGRMSVIEAKPLLAVVDRTKGWISCGMGLGTREASDHVDKEVDALSSVDEDSQHHHDQKIELDTLKPCIHRLLEVLTTSISIVEASIELTMRGGSPRVRKDDERWNILYQVESMDDTKKPSLTLLRQRRKINGAIEAFKGDLATVLKRLAATTLAKRATEQSSVTEAEYASASSTNESCTGMFNTDTYDVAFLMVSLVEIAKEVSATLTISQTMIAIWHANPRKRLWLPSVSAQFWLMRKLSGESDMSAIFDHNMLEKKKRNVYTFTEEDELFRKEKSKHQGIVDYFNRLSHRPNIVQWRVRFSTALSSLKENIHLRYALKLAAGVALLSLPCWLSEARSWFVSQRGVWLIVTYIWVLETSTGATIEVSILRSIGTIAGAVYAIIVWYICDQGNRYGIAFFIVLAQAPSSYFIIYSKRAQSVGLVFCLTQSVILFVPLLPDSADGNTNDSVVHLGILRGYQILLGGVAAFFVNIFIWPLHDRIYLIKSLSHITRQCSTMYLSLAKQMLNTDVIVGPETIKKFTRLEEDIQLELVASREHLETMHIEFSLIPKPIHTLSLVIKTLQRTADLLILLRKCREVALRIIRKEACFNVLNLRKELVSSILLSFWIIGQSLLTKERLPQFLPSCRGALRDLTAAMKKQIDENLLQVQVHSQETIEDMNWNSNSGWISSPSPARISISSPSSSSRRPIRPSNTPPTRRQKVIDYSYFFVFAEHSLLSEIIFEVDKLLFLTKSLVGESNFIDIDYLPNDYTGHHHDHFDPNKHLEADEWHDYHHSMSEHGIDGKRLASQLESQMRREPRERAS